LRNKLREGRAINIFNAGGKKLEKEILKEAEAKMKKCVDAGSHELTLVRTGRATPSMFEHLKVDYYGTLTPLNQLANITAPEPSLIMIQPWDKNSISSIEKAVLKAGFELTPVVSGDVIRIPFPPLSEERRKELVRVAHQLAEECRVSVRNIRREARDEIKNLEKQGEIAEDEAFKAQEDLQESTDKFIHLIDKALHEKEKEILEV
jgi:ribosome recycling factor